MNHVFKSHSIDLPADSNSSRGSYETLGATSARVPATTHRTEAASTSLGNPSVGNLFMASPIPQAGLVSPAALYNATTVVVSTGY